jgi:hypothetical protein
LERDIVMGSQVNLASSSTQVTLSSLLAPGLAAVRRYWKPFLLLQGSALLLVIGYYANGSVKAMCEHVSDVEQRGGLVFSAIAGAFAGALLPEFAKAIMLGDRTIDRQRMRDIGFNLVIFAVGGMIVYVQYRGMAWVFGNDTHPWTIVKKILADQFITTPIYGTPYWLVVFSLRAHRYNLLATIREISPAWYAHKVLPLLIPGWALWIPMVALVYSLPGPLQFCLYCFALAAWSLLMVFIANVETGEKETMNDER